MTTVAFRVDADARIGLGHAMRCLALAEALAARGARTVFVSRPLPTAVQDRLRRCGAGLVVLPTAAAADQDDDAAITLRSLAPFGAAWICVDHYDLGERWEQIVGGSGIKVAAIDDYGQRRHSCVLLIDHNVGVQDRIYDGLAPAETRRLIGPRYALLRPEFTAMPIARRRSGLHRLQISFGGSDPTAETGKAIDAVAEAGLHNVEVDIVVGAVNPRLPDIRATAARLPRATVHVDVQRMDELLRTTDLVIGAAGVSVLERCALGVPSLLLVVAENQRRIAEAASALGAARLLGDADAVSAAGIAAELRRLVESPQSLALMSSAAATVCDGSGAARVAEVMLADSETVR